MDESAYFPITLWTLGTTKLLLVCQSDTWQVEFHCFVMHVLNYERGEDLSHVDELFLFLVDCSSPLPVWWSVYESGCLKPCLVSHETIYWYNSMNYIFAQVWASTNQRTEWPLKVQIRTYSWSFCPLELDPTSWPLSTSFATIVPKKKPHTISGHSLFPFPLNPLPPLIFLCL